MTIWCDCAGCGEHDEFKIDGYAFGDRLLEGVMFTIDKNGKARIQEEDEAYFIGLNKEHWCKLAEEHAEESDVVQCPKCNCDIYIEENGVEGIKLELSYPDTIANLVSNITSNKENNNDG